MPLPRPFGEVLSSAAKVGGGIPAPLAVFPERRAKPFCAGFCAYDFFDKQKRSRRLRFCFIHRDLVGTGARSPNALPKRPQARCGKKRRAFWRFAVRAARLKPSARRQSARIRRLFGDYARFSNTGLSIKRRIVTLSPTSILSYSAEYRKRLLFKRPFSSAITRSPNVAS